MARSDTREKRRVQILDGLFDAMARDGTRGASISEIAESAGIARGALHYYFSSKEEIRVSLMRHLGERYVSGLGAYIDRVMDDGASPDRVAHALVRFHFGGDDVQTERLLAVWIDFWGSAPSDGSLNAVVLDVQEQARAICWRLISHARPELARLDDGARRARAAAMLALIEGALLQWRIAVRTHMPLDKSALSHALVDAALALVERIPAPLSSPAPFRSLESKNAARE
jgi:TetR/AcrR family fatty acid metabolism transcriptional regulator